MGPAFPTFGSPRLLIFLGFSPADKDEPNFDEQEHDPDRREQHAGQLGEVSFLLEPLSLLRNCGITDVPRDPSRICGGVKLKLCSKVIPQQEHQHREHKARKTASKQIPVFYGSVQRPKYGGYDECDCAPIQQGELLKVRVAVNSGVPVNLVKLHFVLPIRHVRMIALLKSQAIRPMQHGCGQPADRRLWRF